MFQNVHQVQHRIPKDLHDPKKKRISGACGNCQMELDVAFEKPFSARIKALLHLSEQELDLLNILRSSTLRTKRGDSCLQRKAGFYDIGEIPLGIEPRCIDAPKQTRRVVRNIAAIACLHSHET